MTQHQFIRFSTNIDQYSLPANFTFPYFYVPHPLALLAMSELQHYLDTQQEWQYDFTAIGHMFGVLVVKNQQGDIGYLSSYAGNEFTNHKIDSDTPSLFVDAIVDHHYYQPYFAEKTQHINTLRQHISTLKSTPAFIALTEKLALKNAEAEQEITAFQQSMAKSKKERKQLRTEAESNPASPVNTTQLEALIHDLGNQSSREKRELKTLKDQWKALLAELTIQHNTMLTSIAQQENECEQLSENLDMEKLRACQFTNKLGSTKSLYDLFTAVDESSPISHSSEENAPKLLQAAFKMGLIPLALGEFWWGASPYEQIRQHKNVYPACQSKCFEILEHMLEGIELDDNSLKQTPSYEKDLEIVYEDEAIVIVNKPAEFLSVPGKFITDSVQTRIKARYPEATGPLIVHRLDMSTSGLLVLTLTAETNKQVQKQFIERTVEKRYTALLEGNIELNDGIINLPLTGDLEDRPRQMVDHKQGRKAETTFQVIERNNNQTKVYLYPKTGRTHQLRVHCAHQAGLNTPIVGDDLYGFKGTRLHLHAGYLKFRHPVTNVEVSFDIESEF
ncbi:RNA pseudouridine synthase [Aliivibrio sp. 1S165]|uniref:RluA family pseudouridine synthase n=1 Tax=unclassified Aliivibrio TaxID=2645654 RepID=UPI00080E3503|nr:MULTISPECIES: pseudouridine synthase [unclassified Aliivibrio]OCH14725.1 RNA pseudouridine synthase [Aliivibrio sp. 1S165]OCH34875.1 RNA pseudouridine synthase [Aliivibrio sp. 1S175]